MSVKDSSVSDVSVGSVWSSFCQVCRNSNGKYRCPYCSVVTCSLQCSKSHKFYGQCMGVRTRTRFVSLSEFDESQLLSDVGLLSSAAHACGRARCASERVFTTRHLSRQHRQLKRAAARRGIKLNFLSAKLFKHQENRSRMDKEKSAIIWYVEWHFDLNTGAVPDVDDVVVCLEFRGDLPLRQELIDVLKKEYTHIFQQIDRVCSDPEDLAFFLEQPRCPANRRLYHLLCADDPLDKSLAGTFILERPIIYVTASADRSQAYELYSKEKMDEVTAERERMLIQLLGPGPADGRVPSSGQTAST